MSDLSQILSNELSRIAHLMRAPNPPLFEIADELDLLALTAEMQGIELGLFRGEITPDEATPRVDALLKRQHMMLPAQAGGRMQ
jgi:hypothetical protein